MWFVNASHNLPRKQSQVTNKPVWGGNDYISTRRSKWWKPNHPSHILTIHLFLFLCWISHGMIWITYAIRRNVVSGTKSQGRRGVRNALRKTDFGFWILDFRFTIPWLLSGVEALDFGFWILDFYLTHLCLTAFPSASISRKGL